ncbi:MAG: dihydrodipicolinate synthase family protein [Clostridia bacterium]
MNERYPRTILATALIPWDENEEFMEGMFRSQLEHLVSSGIHHIYLFGTAGEGYAVTSGLFQRIVRIFAQAMKSPGLFPMVGVIELSVDRVNEKIDLAYDYGIRDFQVSLPAWGSLSDREIRIFLDAVIKPRPDCRFLLYNLARTKRMLDPGELARLGESYGNLAAVKHTRLTDEDATFLSTVSSPLRFFLTEKNFSRIAASSGCGLLLSAGNLDIGMARTFYQDCIRGEMTESKGFLEKMEAIIEKIKETAGEPLIDGAYDKIFTRHNLPGFPLRLKKPYVSFTELQYQIIKEYIDSVLG